MSNNPYAPTGHGQSPLRSGSPNAKSLVTPPAICLIVVASICLSLVFLGLIFDVFLIVSGTVDEMVQPRGMPKSTQLVVRIIWGLVLMGTNTVVLLGAIKMLRLENYNLSKTSAIISVIPCLGPCCILGIPFGIWALVVLGKPEVSNAFR